MIPVSPYSHAVVSTMERQISMKVEGGMSRKLAALKLLEEQPGWYRQTPEGEYLMDAISSRPNWVNDYQWRSA